MTKWAWEETKKRDRSGTEVGKGATDEDRGRGIKRGGGRLMETESGSLSYQFSLAVILAGD